MSAELKTLLGEPFVNREGQTLNFEQALGSAEVIGIYFSAHWCPPCRGFTPMLAEAYDEVKKSHNKFQVVFVTSDQDEAHMKEYLSDMPWVAIPFGDPRIAALKSKYGVRGIPTLVVVDGKGETKSLNGRNDVASNGADAINAWL
eukprot:TRINITY_DN244_c0_g1_i1.p2 TRINITY_DN244_c0_g1~~TRINITY_DN244_c0_g1_i1.p2  ORF type:complete len:161 (+),score=88.86 TRINITY_DN244_c0_g1_i1:51-485(+)